MIGEGRPRRLLALAALAAATILILTIVLVPALALVPRAGLALGGGLLVAAGLPLTNDNGYRRFGNWGAALAMLGVAVAIIGASSSAGFRQERQLFAKPGEQVTIGPWLIEVAAVDPVAEPGSTAIEARLRASRGAGVEPLDPQLRTDNGMVIQDSVPASVEGWSGRLTASIGPGNGDRWPMRFLWAPLSGLLWLGVGLVAAGGVVALIGLSWRSAAVGGVALAIAVGLLTFGESLKPGPAPTLSAPPTSLDTERNAFIGQFNRSSHWLIIADSYASRGDTLSAANLLQAAVRAHPRDYALWLALGNALTDHAGRLSPAAALAYQRSAALAPSSPAPGFFRGIARARSGDETGALAEWRAVLAAAPAEASWRPIVEDRIAETDVR